MPHWTASLTPGFAVCTSLLDHLVRLEEERRGDREPERLGGLQIDDQLELHSPLHREIGWLGTLEDLIYVVSSTSPLARETQPIRHERPSLHIFPVCGQRR